MWEGLERSSGDVGAPLISVLDHPQPLKCMIRGKLDGRCPARTGVHFNQSNDCNIRHCDITRERLMTSPVGDGRNCGGEEQTSPQIGMDFKTIIGIAFRPVIDHHHDVMASCCFGYVTSACRYVKPIVCD